MAKQGYTKIAYLYRLVFLERKKENQHFVLSYFFKGSQNVLKGIYFAQML